MFRTIYSPEQVIHYTVCPIRPIGIRWSSTEWFGTATVCLFGGWLRLYNVAYLCDTCRWILILSSLDPLPGMSVIRIVLHNNLIHFGSPASTAFRSALRSASRPTAVALTQPSSRSSVQDRLAGWVEPGHRFRS